MYLIDLIGTKGGKVNSYTLTSCKRQRYPTSTSKMPLQRHQQVFLIKLQCKNEILKLDTNRFEHISDIDDLFPTRNCHDKEISSQPTSPTMRNTDDPKPFRVFFFITQPHKYTFKICTKENTNKSILKRGGGEGKIKPEVIIMSSSGQRVVHKRFKIILYRH